jgi:spermidine synthase
MVLIPATALGATFPIAVRWFVIEPSHLGRAGGALYAANTTGAVIGALAAGFLLIPTIGVSGTTLVGVAVSGLAIAGAFVLARRPRGAADGLTSRRSPWAPPRNLDGRAKRKVGRAGAPGREAAPTPDARWLAAVVLGLSGFAALMYEIAWSRIFSLVIGPTTYAIAATLAAFIGGTAGGATFGSWVAGRTRRPALYLGLALSSAALAVSCVSLLAGGYLPRLVAHELARAPYGFDRLLMRQLMLAVALVMPGTVGLGAAFPFALEMMRGHEHPAALRLGVVYAINTIGAAAGSLTAGFVSVPLYHDRRNARVRSNASLAAPAFPGAGAPDVGLGALLPRRSTSPARAVMSIAAPRPPPKKPRSAG